MQIGRRGGFGSAVISGIEQSEREEGGRATGGGLGM